MKRRRVKPNDPRRAIAYVRVSTEEQKYGPDAQRAAIEAWAARSGVQVQAWYEEKISGGTELEDRPVLIQALGNLRPLNAGLLLMLCRDRLARDVATAMAIERACEREGSSVLTVDGVANGKEPADIFLRTLLDAFAQYERALIASRIKAVMQTKKARGEVFNHPPFGFRAQAGKLVPDEKERAMARALKQLRDNVHPVRGKPHSIQWVTDQARVLGYTTRRGTPLSFFTVARALKAAVRFEQTGESRA